MSHEENGSIPRFHLRYGEILLALLLIAVGIILEYVDEVVLSKNMLSGFVTFPLWLTSIDASVLLLVNPPMVTPFLTILLGLITHIGSTLAILMLCVAFYLLGHRREAVLLFVTIVLGTLILVPLKAIIARPRPYVTLSSVIPLEQEAGSSFPSGHSERIFGLASVLSRKRYAKTIFLCLLATAVAFSRLYLGVHYLSDVLAGSLIGWIVGKATLRWENRVLNLISGFIKL